MSGVFRPVWLSAYPSVAALLAAEQQAGRLNIALRVVVVSSEQCIPAMRARIAAAWGVEPFNTYANRQTESTSPSSAPTTSKTMSPPRSQQACATGSRLSAWPTRR